jgi:hypothetical protein
VAHCQRFTVFALGIMPYISASIIMQLLTYVVPTFEQLKKEGEAGRRKITQYTRYGTLGLAIFQSLGIAVALEGTAGLVLDPGFGFRMTAVVSLTAGTMFLMWLGEQITERGLGNGISILIFAGIAAGLPSSIGGLLELVRTGAMSIIAAMLIVIVVDSGDLLRGVRRARSTQDSGELCASSSGQQGVWWTIVAPAPQAQYGGCDSSDLCFLDHPAACHHRELVQWHGKDAMRWLKGHRGHADARSADLCDALCWQRHRVLLLLLYGLGVQQPRNGRQPEEEWRFITGYSPRRADGTLYRQDPGVA